MRDRAFACCNCTAMLVQVSRKFSADCVLVFVIFRPASALSIPSLLYHIASLILLFIQWPIRLFSRFICTVSNFFSSSYFSLSVHLPLFVLTHAFVSVSVFLPHVLWVTASFVLLLLSYNPYNESKNWLHLQLRHHLRLLEVFQAKHTSTATRNTIRVWKPPFCCYV